MRHPRLTLGLLLAGCVVLATAAESQAAGRVASRRVVGAGSNYFNPFSAARIGRFSLNRTGTFTAYSVSASGGGGSAAGVTSAPSGAAVASSSAAPVGTPTAGPIAPSPPRRSPYRPPPRPPFIIP